MRLDRAARIEGEAIVLLLIVLAILGGGVWFLYSARQDAEKNARAFANEAVNRIVVKYDEKFLHVHLSPEAQVTYLQSWRDRLMDRLREFSVPAQPIELKGNVEFSSYFFDPRGTFRAQLNYPTTSAYLDMGVSRGMTVWQIDSINLTWNPPATPTPTPTPVVTPAPTPASKSKRKSKP